MTDWAKDIRELNRKVFSGFPEEQKTYLENLRLPEMNLRCAISIDDVNPLEGWRIFGEPAEVWLKKLYDEFGCKFTLFIPADYHGKAPLIKNRYWVDWLVDQPHFELAAHGYRHQCKVPQKWGECEFAEIYDADDFDAALKAILDTWHTVEYRPKGWKSPGWLCCPAWPFALGSAFEYVSLHYEHNRDILWPCKTFFGHDGIHELKSMLDFGQLSLHNDNMIMLTSHISGDWNDNVWNEKNFNSLFSSLETLLKLYPDIEFVTLKECV